MTFQHRRCPSRQCRMRKQRVYASTTLDSESESTKKKFPFTQARYEGAVWLAGSKEKLTPKIPNKHQEKTRQNQGSES